METATLSLKVKSETSFFSGVAAVAAVSAVFVAAGAVDSSAPHALTDNAIIDAKIDNDNFFIIMIVLYGNIYLIGLNTMRIYNTT